MEIIEILKLLLSPIVKLTQSIFNNYSISTELEKTQKDIEYLNFINDNDKYIDSSLKDLVYRRKYGVSYSKYIYFKSNKKIENEIEDSEYRVLSLFTYKEKNSFKVKMKVADIFLYYFYSFIGLILFILGTIIFFKILIIGRIQPKEIFKDIQLSKAILYMIVLYILSFICLIYYLRPIFIYKRYKRLNN